MTAPFFSLLLLADALTGCQVDRVAARHGGRGPGHTAGVAADGAGR